MKYKYKRKNVMIKKLISEYKLLLWMTLFVLVVYGAFLDISIK